MATVFPMDLVEIGCEHCAGRLDFEFTFAFQPIVNIQEKKLFGFTREEATQKWRSGEISHSVLGDIIDFENNYKVDEYDVIDKAFKMDLVDIVYSDRDGISVNPNYFKKHAKKARLNVNI